VPWAGSAPTDRILMHLAEIGAGRCTITDDTVVAEQDPEMSQVLLGLLVLYEDLNYASRQRAEAETALRLVAEERARLLEDRRQAVVARDQFLAVAAHELRTPLATLALLVDYLIVPLHPHSTTEPGGVVVPRRQLAMLKRQVDRLTALVIEMLDVSRITSGRLQLSLGPVDLRDVVTEVLDRFDLEIQRRHVTLNVNAPDPAPGIWDAARIDQVVTNLISNALKYGAGRPIEVSVRVEASQAVVVVRDHGIGIPEDEQSKIFGPFARVLAATHHTGLGLGLWIAQQIVQASGGRINVDSRPEQGSTFTVELPL
jgi:two-component system OmpR family sensor kinase